MEKLIYIIDPQSINSLATYDRCMIEGIRDLNIHYFCNEEYNDEKLNKNVIVHPVFKYSKYSNTILKGLSYFISMLTIICYAIFERPRISHFQWIRVWYIDWPIIFFLKRIIKTKIIFTVHNILPRKQKKNTFVRFKKLYDFADCLIVHTKTTQNDLISQFGITRNKIVVMPHGIIKLKVDDDELAKSGRILEQKYDFNDKIVFAALGVQCPYKGTDLLLKAWIGTPELRDRKDLLLLIAGKPSGIDFPTEIPENVIIIPNLLNNPDFTYLMKRADVIMLPYRTIEQSGVLLSLINEHKPYCCTRVGELAKPFEYANVGWIIPEVNPEAIAKTLIEIVEHPEDIVAKKNDIEGWSRLENMYSWSNSNAILRETYLQIMES